MPNLAQMYAWVNGKTSYSRPDEIYPALSEGGFLVFTAVLKEFSGFFLKFDTSTIVLTPGQSVYQLPPDCDTIVHLAERQTASETWRPMRPTTLGDALDRAQQQVSWWDLYGGWYGHGSQFGFYGPYLPASAVGSATTLQTQQINVEPAIDFVRMCEIAYTAKWIDIVNAQSFLMMPNEGTYAMQNYAAAEIHRGNNDTLSAEYEAKGQRHLTAFLTWVRDRQTTERPTVEEYGG